MRIATPALLIVVVLGIALSACGDEPPAVDQATPTAADAMSCADETAIDLSAEPDYSADYLHRWRTHDGCEVRLDYVMTRSGACFDGVDEILMGWPLGTTHQNPHDYRIFFKDPDGVTGTEAASNFDPDSSLPPHAVNTGLRWDGNGLWLVPGDDTSVWLASDDHVEYWPQELEAVVCA